MMASCWLFLSGLYYDGRIQEYQEYTTYRIKQSIQNKTKYTKQSIQSSIQNKVHKTKQSIQSSIKNIACIVKF
jgi:hypothetical protein